jgi:hypothetical protein
MNQIHWGNSLIKQPSEDGGGEIVERDGESFYRISNYDRMPPFFIAVVSGSEHWMFLSSGGGLTCGRRNPDNALFPYYTDDKIHDAGSTTGADSVLLVSKNGRTSLWQPFEKGVSPYALERNLYKNLPGTRLVYEEINHDLELVFTSGWSCSERFGFVKTTGIRNMADGDCHVEVLDGLRNLLPYGTNRQMQNELSTLLDAYKQAERVPGTTAGLYTLSSILTDRAEPSEALRATVAWCTGLEDPKVLLSEDQVSAFQHGLPLEAESHSRGKRGAFYVQSAFTIPGGSEKCWYIIADINQGPSQTRALLVEIRQGVTPDMIEADVETGEQHLLQLVGEADGCQLSADPLTAARHFSNTLFNIMRGGTFYDDYVFPPADFLDFVATWNKSAKDKFSELVDGLGGDPTLSSVMEATRRSGDPDMERLALEYLPLTFSRRHGDPSRPWNQFSIDIKNADGSDRLHYQGNWRDIFQNWEALSLSYPQYIESFITKFVNASTADGYNPYRITRHGIDWEVLEPDNSWSNIGYWGDHQINYLLKLIELSQRYHPGKLGELLDRDIFVYANVPYRIKAYEDLVSDPRDTVFYDNAAEEEIGRRVAQLGSDGKLIALANNSICRVSLLEKLLVPVLAKNRNLVPGGGIWMNTQRPEWNDANNALVGYGLSMVTLCYLRRFLVRFGALIEDNGASAHDVSREVLAFFRSVLAILEKSGPSLDAGFDTAERKAFMDELGLAAEDYRASVYAGFSGEKATLQGSDLRGFVDLALAYCDDSIARNRRPDGLYHSYNLIHFGQDGYDVENLYEMLEGQVAVLSSGYLDAEQSLALLNSLRVSAIYRSDQNSYMLYPDKEQVSFLENNVVPNHLIVGSDWIRKELESGRSDILEQDLEGGVHFNPEFRNSRDLSDALARRGDVSWEDVDAICGVYEDVFRHRQFTGRSGSMFKYEGLGSIYWHMVSKLLLATAEVIEEAGQQDTARDQMTQLLDRFDDIQNGIGVHNKPEQYGAFPIDPYSHTPGFTGVQQPGMTGQVKEDVLTRFIELGVRVSQGRIRFAPAILKRDEFLRDPFSWNHPAGGDWRRDELQPDSLAFTLCAVTVVYRLAQDYAIEVFQAGGSSKRFPGNRLSADDSCSLFQRDGRIEKIVVDIPAEAFR